MTSKCNEFLEHSYFTAFTGIQARLPLCYKLSAVSNSQCQTPKQENASVSNLPDGNARGVSEYKLTNYNLVFYYLLITEP